METELSRLLKQAAIYIVHHDIGSIEERHRLAKELLYQALLVEGPPSVNLPPKTSPASGVKTRGMTADIPPPHTKPRGTGMSCPHCGAGTDELGHKADCPLRSVNVIVPITRHPRFGSKPFAICHWDTFDSDDEDGGVVLVDGADTLEEAIQKVKEHYGARLKADGADQVDVIDPAGNIVWNHKVG